MAPGNSIPKRPLQNCAFTLIELLITLSIISMLIGLLLPALAQARAAGRRTQCASHQHQISIALTQFAGDWFDWIPRNGTSPWTPTGKNPGLIPWAEATYPYLGAPGTHTNFASPIYLDPAHPNPNHRIQYVMNGVSFKEDPNGLIRASADSRPAVHSALIRFPDKMAYLTAFTDDRDNSIAIQVVRRLGIRASAGLYDLWKPDHFWGDDFGSDLNAWSVRRLGINRHGKYNNVLHVDGHISQMNAPKLLDPQTWYDGRPQKNP